MASEHGRQVSRRQFLSGSRRIKSTPQKLIAEGMDWPFITEP